MELSPGGGDGGTVIPFPVSGSTQTGAGSENQNTEGVVDSNFEIEPEMYDFSFFLEGDIVDDVSLELKEMLKSAPLPSSGHNGHVVPEVVGEVAAEKNMEQLVPPPPSPPPPPPPPPTTPPQLAKPSINLSPGASARLRWTEELHASFVDALKQLGGAFAATPKSILDIMDVEGLSLHQVKSHLQKYRLGKKPCKDWKKFYRRGSSFSRALGGPSNPVPISQPPRAKNQRRRRAKPNKQEHGSLYLKIEAQKHVQRCLEAQRLYAKIAAGRMAANQNMGGYELAANQNARGYAFAANQNMGGYASVGRNIYPKNNFIFEATMAPEPSFYPYQLNPYNAHTPAATVNAGISTARKPYQLQGMIEARPHPLTKASFPTEAASGSYLQGSSSASGESSGTAGMSDEEFVESFLIDFDEINGDFQNSQ